MALPIVAVVGRPYVGQSTLFNRIVGERVSIVEDVPGVTRDRIYSKAEWLTKEFYLIDTGGIEMADTPFMTQIRAQAEIAMDEADVIVFVVNGREGITSDDEAIANILYRSDKPIILAVNQIDDVNIKDNIYDFYTLGFGEPIATSSIHGIGVGDVLDAIIHAFPDKSAQEYDADTVCFSLIGRPNVGKSSLTNAILGEDRVIVSQIAGTTRDAIDTPFTKDGEKYVIIDTAGIRKRGKVYENIEKYSVLRALSAIERSNVVLVVINAEEGIIEQDRKIAGYAHEAGKGVVIVVNKWDAVKKDEKTMQLMIEDIRDKFKYLDYAPIVFVSALENKRVHTIFPEIQLAFKNQNRRIPTSVLNDVLQDALALTPPPSHRGHAAKFYYVSQVATAPPTFVFFVNDTELVHFSYQRYLENRLRATFDFEGTPIHFILRQKNNDK